MTKGDDRILETLDSSGLSLSPKVLAFNTEYTGNYISKRLKLLSDANLVEKEDLGLYSITSLGREYIDGEVEASEIEHD